jgi:23S rRNA pseudouridine1911/1915/1917 synthase
VNGEISILHRDEHVLVVDKPAGMLSVPADGVAGIDLVRALQRQGLSALAVHRLDRETSGVLMFALDEETRAALEQLFRSRAIVKTYWALAAGRVRPADGEWTFPILDQGEIARISPRGKPCRTRYRTLAALPNTTELEIDLQTGRYNQIRVHSAHAGYALVGERKYARGGNSPIAFRSRRVALHAWRLAFEHPRNGARIEVEAPLPADLVELRARALACTDRLPGADRPDRPRGSQPAAPHWRRARARPPDAKPTRES